VEKKSFQSEIGSYIRSVLVCHFISYSPSLTCLLFSFCSIPLVAATRHKVKLVDKCEMTRSAQFLSLFFSLSDDASKKHVQWNVVKYFYLQFSLCVCVCPCIARNRNSFQFWTTILVCYSRRGEASDDLNDGCPLSHHHTCRCMCLPLCQQLGAIQVIKMSSSSSTTAHAMYSYDVAY
jgi:hypothetical protein